MSEYTIEHGDCLAVLKTYPDNSIDCCVTDPPYALPGGFMGKAWDNHDGREDTGFGYWLAGFTDGEGCFRVQKHERGTHICAFSIKLRRDDKSVLERIRRFVGHGTVIDAEGDGISKPQAVYVVQDRDGCDALVGLFRRFPLTAKKANDFEVWAEAVEEWLGRPRGNRWVGQSDQTQASILKARLENVRKYVEVPWSGHRFQDWTRMWAMECLRVLKPGGYMLAFGAPKQYHRLAAGIEDAGFEIRNCIGWVFGSGFPKSLNVGTAVAELKGANSLEAKQWAGWGTDLKPAWESIVVARKPLIGTVAENVLEHGTGAINIDGCRVATQESLNGGAYAKEGGRTESQSLHGVTGMNQPGKTVGREFVQPVGRFPANLIHDGSDEVVEQFPNNNPSCRSPSEAKPESKFRPGQGNYQPQGRIYPEDSGTSAARFFYCAKANKNDRGAGNEHPTVKPTDLMRYLCRLVCPPEGIVLDPFMGSGSTGKAALLEGFAFIGIEREAQYIEIAKTRIGAAS